MLGPVDVHSRLLLPKSASSSTGWSACASFSRRWVGRRRWRYLGDCRRLRIPGRQGRTTMALVGYLKYARSCSGVAERSRTLRRNRREICPVRGFLGERDPRAVQGDSMVSRYDDRRPRSAFSGGRKRICRRARSSDTAKGDVAACCFLILFTNVGLPSSFSALPGRCAWRWQRLDRHLGAVHVADRRILVGHYYDLLNCRVGAFLRLARLRGLLPLFAEHGKLHRFVRRLGVHGAWVRQAA